MDTTKRLSMEDRMLALEKEHVANSRIRSYFGTIVSMTIAGIVSAIIMLITTNQTTNRNSEQIESMDVRQRAMQDDLHDIGANQQAQARSLDRIETYLERSRNEGIPR